MAITNQEIWDIIDHHSRKELKGNTTRLEDRSKLLKEASYELFNIEYKLYEQTQEMTDTLKRFERSVLGSELSPSTDSYGSYIPLPTDYAHITGLSYKQSGNVYNHSPIDVVTDEEWYERRGSYLKKPTVDNPIATLRGSKLYYAPDSNDDVTALQTSMIEMSYLRYPTEPVYATTYNSTTDTYTYDSGNSVELDWNNDDKYKIASRILQKIGVNLSEQQLFQYGQLNESQL